MILSSNFQQSLDSISVQQNLLNMQQVVESFAKKSKENISVIDLFLESGFSGQFIIFILFVLSIITFYLFVERLLTINSALKREDEFFNSIKDFLHDHKYDSAIDLCKKTNTPIARMLEKGILHMNKSLKDISKTINNVARLELSKLENNLAFLATIAGVAPMLGFLGTVIGMILAFYQMAECNCGVDIKVLSKGIYTAMTTTVVGLVVGVLAYLSYNFLVAKVTKAVYEIESISMEFIELMSDKKSN